MKNQTIPHTDLQVSPLCLGTMTFGTPVGEAEAVKLMHQALDRGVNFIDTANAYEGYTRFVGSPGGITERIVGQALKGRRDRYVVATKMGMKVGSGPEDEYCSPAAIRKQLDLSLQRLGIDRIDLYYMHRPDPTTPLVDMVGALAEAIKAGKIRHYAVSNYSAAQLRELLAVADQAGLPRPVAHQPPLGLLKPEVTADLLPLCAKEQIAIVPYNVLQGGLLTGKYRRGQPPPPGSRKAEKDGWVWALEDTLFDKLEKFEAEAKAVGHSMTQHALRWALHQPAVVSLILGIKRLDQLEEAIAAIA